MSRSSVITCIGAGNIGRAWAVVFARAGYSVNVYDLSNEALEHAKTMLERTVALLADAQEIDTTIEVLERVSFTSNLEQAVVEAIHVQECVTERIEVKSSIFEQLDTMCPEHVTLASSTSELLPSQFLKVSTYPERCLVAHPVNPPHLIPLVELCPAPDTSADSMNKVETLFKQCGMSPIVMTREINGFILNRLQAAILGEAFHLITEGLCSVEDIDKAMTEGLARRWSFIGPLATGHLNATGGYPEYIEFIGPAWKRLIQSMRSSFKWNEAIFGEISTELFRQFPLEKIPDAQCWRDDQLIKLAKHLKDQPKFKSSN